MSRRTNIDVVATAVFLVLGLAWTTSQSAAQSPPASPALPAVTPTEKADLETTASRQEIDDAIERFKERDFEGALKLLQEVVKKDTDLPPAQVIMAQLFSQARVPLAVRDALEGAVRDAPDDPEAYIIMGDLAVRERRFTEAVMLYQKADELTVRFQGSAKRKVLLMPRILSGMASIDEAQQDWSEAQKRLEALLKLEPTSSQALQRLAHSLFQQQNPAGALERLKEAAKIDPKMLTPEAFLSQFYEQAKDRENAKRWMAEALRVAPKDLRTHLIAGQWTLETGQIQEAATQAAEALKIDPKSLDALILSGVVAMFNKDYTTAERYFETAHLQEPRNFAAANNLALVLADQEDEAKQRRALEYAKSNVQRNPRSAEAASTYGWVLYKLGRFDEAEKAFQVAVSSGAVAPDTAFYIASLAYDRGRESQAQQWLEMALKSEGPFAMRRDAEALMEKLKR